MKFTELNIIPPILDAIKDKNYSKATSIQEKAIPFILNHRDVLGCAQTGTGKTAAFAIPIIQKISKQIKKQSRKSSMPVSLILTPTRELAIQINDNILQYSKYTKVKHTVIFGGVKQFNQVKVLQKGLDILVATPGRLLDLISQNIINLNQIEIFVLDEADRMLDMGFINDIKKVLNLLPQQRQSLFFSATMPQNILELSKQILNDPEKIEITPISSTAESIKQHLYYTNKSTKRNVLLHILENPDINPVLVFCQTKHGCDKLIRFLHQNNITASTIHGNKSQNHRQRALLQFKSNEIRVLVATDIAARGIDIKKLKYVINYEIPNISETYVHRIGRSGRAGEVGFSISISEPEENIFIRDIENLIKQKMNVIIENPFPQTDKSMSLAQRKELNKEKQLKKQAFFANRKKIAN